MITFSRHSYFLDATIFENNQQLSLIMRLDIADCFNGKSESKKHKLCLRNTVKDLSPLSTQILSELIALHLPFPRVIELALKRALDNRILTELIGRHDLNSYDCEAFQLVLEYNVHSREQR